MCELLGLNSNAPAAATLSFTGLTSRGGHTGDHVDGWGIAFHSGDACRVFVEDQRACDSALVDFLRLHPIRARTVLAHVRKATQGVVSLANCHPFQREWAGRHWVFAHNGDLKNFQPPLDGSFMPIGQTDSERAFCWLLQMLRQRYGCSGLPEWPLLAPVLSAWVASVAEHGPFNILLSDGRGLYVHASTRLCWLQRQAPFGMARLVDRDLSMDLATANSAGDQMVVVATAALTRDEPWQALAPGEARVFASGQCLWSQAGQSMAVDQAVPALV